MDLRIRYILAVSFELQHSIDNVLKHFRACNAAFAQLYAYQQYRNGVSFAYFSSWAAFPYLRTLPAIDSIASMLLSVYRIDRTSPGSTSSMQSCDVLKRSLTHYIYIVIQPSYTVCAFLTVLHFPLPEIYSIFLDRIESMF